MPPKDTPIVARPVQHQQFAGACIASSNHVLLGLLLSLFCGLACIGQAHAEPGRIELGTNLAPSMEKHIGSRGFATNTHKQGISFGVDLRYRLLEEWFLEAEVLYATRGSEVESNGAIIGGFDFTYVELPVLLRYGWRVPILARPGERPPLTAYLTAGPSVSFLLDGVDINDGEPVARDALSSYDIGMVAGIGAAWDFAPQWGASLEVRYDRGFVDAFSNGVESKNQALLLTLGISYALSAGDTDRDNDGLADHVDRCWMEPENENGYEDEDGCPDGDDDKDRIVDAADKCPREAEDVDDFEDDDGCPDTDNDADGIVDAEDRCPVEAFPHNKDLRHGRRGCQPRFDRVRVERMASDEEDRLVLTPALEFEQKSFELSTDQKHALDQVAELLEQYYPEMLLRLEGHADGEGKGNVNVTLSEQRANAVADYLTTKGIARERLIPKGYGEERPISREENLPDKRRNRRVELVIIAKP